MVNEFRTTITISKDLLAFFFLLSRNTRQTWRFEVIKRIQLLKVGSLDPFRILFIKEKARRHV